MFSTVCSSRLFDFQFSFSFRVDFHVHLRFQFSFSCSFSCYFFVFVFVPVHHQFRVYFSYHIRFWFWFSVAYYCVLLCSLHLSLKCSDWRVKAGLRTMKHRYMTQLGPLAECSTQFAASYAPGRQQCFPSRVSSCLAARKLRYRAQNADILPRELYSCISMAVADTRDRYCDPPSRN